MRDLPAPVYVSSVRAQGLRPRRGGTTLAMTTCSVLPSVPYDAVGPPNSIFLSRLNTQPTRCPVNASPLPSRTATHDSGPTWFATPWLGGTCTRETYRFVPAHRLVKILERPAGQKFTRFQDRRRHRRSGSRMSILTSRPRTSKGNPESPFRVVERWAWALFLQRRHLLPQSDVLQHQVGAAPTHRPNGTDAK